MTRISADRVSELAAREWGASAIVLPSTDAGLQPSVTLEPDSSTMAAAMLDWATREGVAVVPRGSGTKLGRNVPRAHAVLSTIRLTSGSEHRAGDLTATLPSGATLDAINTLLGRERQWLPLDPPLSSRATIGGVVATNDSGPRQHRHGTPRDLIIGIEMALTNGRVAHAGGQVVKNVAGYDLARLMCGSFGSLAVITSATFKLAPLPPASRTLVASLPEGRRAADLALAIGASALTPSAIELEGPPFVVLVRFETTTSAAEQQAAAAVEICRERRAVVTVLEGVAEQARWRAAEARISADGSTLLKLAVLPTFVADAIDAANRLANARRIEYAVSGRAAVGTLFVQLSGDTDHHPPIIEALRRDVAAARGFLTLIRASEHVARSVDHWGDLGDSLKVLRAIKTRFDPANILYPGGGPGGT